LALVSTSTGRRPTIDAQAAGAAELARAALDDLADPGTVGDHLGVEADDDRVVTHLFECTLPGYRGWRWAVTVARASRARAVTVDEMVLLPGPEALLAPEWVPWSERLRPGDLGVGDLLPTREDDDRLEPGWNAAAPTGLDPVGDGEVEALTDEWVSQVVTRLGLERPRVLSPIGLDDAVDRWLAGDHGPESRMAQAAPASCATCGFRISLTGALARAFGVCANSYSPSDGHVVSLDHGCGAHSEAAVLPAPDPVAPPVVDDIGFDVIEVEPAPDPDDIAAPSHGPGSVHDDDPSEEMGHG
jgi:hypothetical protein